MKKKLICLTLFTLFLCGCNEKPGIVQNNTNNINSDINSEVNANNATTFSVRDYDDKHHIKWTSYDNVGFWVSSFVILESKAVISNYLNLDDLERIAITSEDEYNTYCNKVNNLNSLGVEETYLSDVPMVDFNMYKIELTAVYLPSYRCDFSMKNMIINSTTIKQYIECEKYTGFNENRVSVGLVYLIIPKSSTLNVQTEKNIIEHSQEVVVKKPIVYFYPEEEMDLTVKFPNEDRLLTTYPKYNDGWNIHLNKDGTFTTGDSDREYYAIYFDAISNYECKFDEGFYVTKDNAISFIEEKMDYIGFNNHEANEFMMYWLPILENNERSLVYFEQTEERNGESPLEFSINPDILIRTIIHIKKVDEEVNIPEQQLTHYERNGFVVTEWGGVEY